MLTTLLGIDFAATLQWTALALALWCVISSLELLVRVRDHRAGGALGWDMLGVRSGWLYRGGALGRVFQSRSMIAAPLVRLAAAIALPFAWHPVAMLVLLLIVAACTILLNLLANGGDGADKAALVALAAAIALAAGLAIGDRWLCLAGVLWAAGQLAIAYSTSGVAKLVRPFWRDGSAIAAAMTSYRSGHRFAAAVVRHPARATALAWVLMLAEALFPLALLAPPPVLIAALIGFALFHFATALIMGLNTYPWAFAAMYPAAIALSHAIWAS